MQKTIKKTIVLLIIIICIFGIIYSSYKVITWKKNINENNRVNSNLKQNVHIEKNKYKIDFVELQKKNPDTIAYIKVNNTNIDYIVVKGNDNEYYLYHNFEKKWNVAGWIFGDYKNKFDETDRNLIIYGHNTKDGSMFGTLNKTLEKEWYKNNDNHTVILVTKNGTYYYKVFSTYSISPTTDYLQTQFNDNKQYYEFLKKIKKRSNNNYKIKTTDNDKILTLSSCIGMGEKRVVLHAKLIKKVD